MAKKKYKGKEEVNYMKEQIAKNFSEVTQKIKIDVEDFYKTWHILSWVFLLIGYSLIIINMVLFTENPQLLFNLGMFMLSISLVNLFLIVLNILFLVYIIVKEEGWYYYREYLWSSSAYTIISLILLKASLM
jgi:hypothetical protein